MKIELEDKIKNLNERVNTLQTNLENSKTDLAFLHKQKVSWVQDREIMEKEVETLKKKIQQREAEFGDKDYELRKIIEEQKSKEDDKKDALNVV